MENYKVDVSESAEEDLLSIVRYIASQFSATETALQMMESIEEALSKLSDMPQAHPLVRDERLASMGYRRINVKNYVAFFTIDEVAKVVDVERILYARRDWASIL